MDFCPIVKIKELILGRHHIVNEEADELAEVRAHENFSPQPTFS